MIGACGRRPVGGRMSIREIRWINRWPKIRDAVIDKAHQFLFRRQPPVSMFTYTKICAIRASLDPCPLVASILLLPHKAGHVVGHRAVSVVSVALRLDNMRAILPCASACY